MNRALPLVDSSRHNVRRPPLRTTLSRFILRTLLTVLRRFDDESVAEAWLTALRWSDGIRCPECDSDNIAKPLDRRPMPYRCRKCRTQFSITSHSAMQATKLPLSVWAQAFHICSALSNPDAIDIRDILTITNKAAWSLAMRIYEAWELHMTSESNRYGQRRLL